MFRRDRGICGHAGPWCIWPLRSTSNSSPSPSSLSAGGRLVIAANRRGVRWLPRRLCSSTPSVRFLRRTAARSTGTCSLRGNARCSGDGHRQSLRRSREGHVLGLSGGALDKCWRLQLTPRCRGHGADIGLRPSPISRTARHRSARSTSRPATPSAEAAWSRRSRFARAHPWGPFRISLWGQFPGDYGGAPRKHTEIRSSVSC